MRYSAWFVGSVYLEHVVKEKFSKSLSLKRLVDIKIKDAAYILLMHCSMFILFPRG